MDTSQPDASKALHDNPLIDHIAQTLRDEYGIDTRPGAEAALAEWEHAPELTERERLAVLSRFPASQVVDFTFDQAGWLAAHLNEEHERLCALSQGGDHRDDIAMIEAIATKLA